MRHILLTIMLACAAICAYSAEYKREIYVNPDGTGDFKTITESLDAIRAYMDYDVTVHIAPGVYHEKVVIPSWLQNVHFIGDNPDNTIITWGDHANMYKVIPNWTETVDYSETPDSITITANDSAYVAKMGTFRTFTVRVDGSDITFENLTIENNAPRQGQAVALHTEGDNLTFTNCRLLGNQDTLFTGGRGTELRFYDCYIEGTTDFIFGQATALFKDCEICCKTDSYITAASTPRDVEIGYVFDNCHITALPEVKQMYLGRPWRPYAYTVFIDCTIDAPMRPARWHNWNDPANEQTARYGEYGTVGAYADTSGQAEWAKVLTPERVNEIRQHFAKK